MEMARACWTLMASIALNVSEQGQPSSLPAFFSNSNSYYRLRNISSYRSEPKASSAQAFQTLLLLCLNGLIFWHLPSSFEIPSWTSSSLTIPHYCNKKSLFPERAYAILWTSTGIQSSQKWIFFDSLELWACSDFIQVARRKAHWASNSDCAFLSH